jgi:diguanylate cyclase (GGDEF)-like protein
MTGVRSTHELRLTALAHDVGRASSVQEAYAVCVDRLEAALGVPCLVRAQHGTEWHTIAPSGTAKFSDIDAGRAYNVQLAHSDVTTEILIARPVESPKTAGRSAATVEATRLDDAAWRDALGATITTALQLVDARVRHADAERRAGCIERFSRALVGISDSPTLHRAIVEHMARAVDARVGAVALPVAPDNLLAVTATYGYPAVLVEHVRLAPGEGVLGRVYTTGEPLLVSNASAIPGRVARRRYQTDSYVAVPLAGPDGVVAVVSLTDKTGARPFTNDDLQLLMALAVPAALAVTREQLRDRTNDLAHLATVDALTGLFNRRYFETRVEQELQRQRRQSDELSLLMLDLDNFKELNDTQGHLVGDVALREVAEILRRAVRIFDVCARYGGEEFVILMPGAGSSTALRIAERIRRQVEQHFASGLRSGVPVPLTVSIGASTATPSTTRDALVAEADAALLESKAGGKNRVTLRGSG